MKLKPYHLALMACYAALQIGYAQGSPGESTNPGPVFAPIPTDAVATASAPASTNLTAEAATNAAPATAKDSNLIPLIQFVDVPLTAAIENLARQANLNYILDPKIVYGQGGDKAAPQPNISIRWENLTAEQALYAVLDNYDLQLTLDPKTKIARISAKDPALPDPLVTKVIQLKYAAPSNILSSVQSALSDRRSKVVADTRTSQLVIVATEKEMSAVEDLVARLDAPTRQVLIEANLIETSRSPTSVRGVDWSGTLQAQNVSFGNGILTGISSNNPTTITLPNGITETVAGSSSQTSLATLIGGGGLNWNTANGFTPGIGFLNADGAKAVLSFLNQDSDTKVLSTPRTITLDNEPASLSVTRASPIINVTAGTVNTSGGSTINYTNLGTQLQVTPRISANNLIYLKITPEVSSIADTVTRTVGGQIFQADEYDVRKMDTQVLIPSGNTLVMGGLVSDATSKGYSKVPMLGDIPFAGWAFRHESRVQAQRNLLIFITPTVVQDSDFQPTRTDFLKNKLEKDKDSKVGYWDSGKPLDWTKPFRKSE
jgi:type II secretory pathway component GspD/PulD (secretin)